MVVPYGDPNYLVHRPTIGLKDGELTQIGHSMFAFNSLLAPLKRTYDAGQMAIFPATHNYSLNLSHFDAQEVLLSGVYKSQETGWLNRFLELNPADRNKFRAMTLGAKKHDLLLGKSFSLSTTNIENTIQGQDLTLLSLLSQSFGDSFVENKYYSDMINKLGSDTIRTLQDLQKLKPLMPYKPAVTYGTSGLDNWFRNIAFMIKNTDTQLFATDLGGFDSHQNQKTLIVNPYKSMTSAISSFLLDLGDYTKDTVVLVMTEFGRTIKENGSAGTDHGRASCWMAFGAVKGGIYGEWPGLAPNQLREGRYLNHSIDNGDIICEILKNHLGVQDPSQVVDNHNYRSIGFIPEGGPAIV
jgi:uncharacterized protein (DUF1501 family)